VIDFLEKLKVLFHKEDYPTLFLFFGTMFLNSLLEILGIGLLMPFVLLLGKPSALSSRNPLMDHLYHSFTFQNNPHLIIKLAIGIIVIYIVKNILLFLLSYWQTGFIFDKQAVIMSRLFRAYLMSPYSFHLKQSLARLQHNLGSVNAVLQGIVLQIFYCLTEGVVMVGLFAILLLAQPLFTVIIFGMFGITLTVYFRCIKQRMRIWSEEYNEHFKLLLQQMNQGLGSIKEAKLFGREGFLAERYSYHCFQCATRSTVMEVLSKNPRSFIEMIAVCLVMAVVIFYLMIGKTPEEVFGAISLFALAAIRLMPSLSRISSAMVTIKGNMPIFDEIHKDLVLCENFQIEKRQQEKPGAISFDKNIEVKDVSFAYEGSTSLALNKISLNISKNKNIGFVGSSGAGKTTAIDIILGLLKPSSGVVLVDGQDIQPFLRSWQDKIGYIPQAIYLSDDTIKSNIAFGIDDQDIDEKKIWDALRLAQLDQFIRGLPHGIDTTIGERGVRLSGGQRQRIGIARALYNAPELLVMDEATAALDNETERAFMESLTSLSGNKTILIIAHRLTTVRQCDIIFFLKDGRVLSHGKYDELLAKCPEFQQMARGEHF